MVFDFFALAVFQKHSKKFWRLTENPGKYFSGVREIPENFFPEKFVHARTRTTELFPTTQKPDKTP